MPHPGPSWQQRGSPARQPHEYIRAGTTKILTLFHPASGQVRLHAAQHCTNAVLHPWLRERLTAILAELPAPAVADPALTHAAWEVWQSGLTRPFTLPEDLPPLRLLLVWDNLTGHKTPALVLWLCAHGIMPLYTPVGGSWLNMAESIQRVLKRRSLDSIRTVLRRSGGGSSRRRGAGMPSRRRLSGTANAGSGAGAARRSRSIGSAAPEPARTNRFVLVGSGKHSNAKSHDK